MRIAHGPEVRRATLEEYQRHDGMGNCPELRHPQDEEKIESCEVPRAGGGVLCAVCGREYNDHPRVLGALWVTSLCGGDLVKL